MKTFWIVGVALVAASGGLSVWTARHRRGMPAAPVAAAPAAASAPALPVPTGPEDGSGLEAARLAAENAALRARLERAEAQGGAPLRAGPAPVAVPAPEAAPRGVLTAWTPELLAQLGIAEGYAADRAVQILAEERAALHGALQAFYLEAFAGSGEDSAAVCRMSNLEVMARLKGRYEAALDQRRQGHAVEGIPYFRAWDAFIRAKAAPIRERTYREMSLLLTPDRQALLRERLHKPGVFDFGSDGISIVIDFSGSRP